ncbi:MAG: quinone oxidoreductase [Chloroflexi bacterium]|nr:quinone oxidoreductase [Chloroflexota bacterium]
MQAIQITAFGGSDALALVDLPVPDPGPGQVLIKVAHAGVNYIDTYHRTGLYPLELPLVIGLEGAGTVAAAGEGVSGVNAGDRVAWSSVSGSYAQYLLAPAEQVVKVPDGVGLRDAAAAMLQGMTSQYLCKSTYPLQAGQWCLIHAGAGGVGLLLTQMCKLIGAKVITTVSNPAKAELSRAAGADEVINYTESDFVAEVGKITDGQGVAVVYDGVGKTTAIGSLKSLQRRGLLALFGNASGAPDPIEPLLLNSLGSLYLTRPSLFDYISTRPEFERRSAEVFDWIAAGQLKLRIEFEYPLAEARTAHDMLEGRKTTGKVLLNP